MQSAHTAVPADVQALRISDTLRPSPCLCGLLPLPPQALRSLSLTAPSGILEGFMEGSGRFTGLTRLQLRGVREVEQHPVEVEVVSRTNAR